jgi:hypothetical protein
MTSDPKKECCSDLLNFFLHLGQAKVKNFILIEKLISKS